MAATTRPTWARRDGAGEMAYGPRVDFTYDDGTPSAIVTSWSPHEGPDIEMRSRAGVGLSLSPGEAARLATALDRAVTMVAGWFSIRRWRGLIASAAALAAIIGGYCLAVYTGPAADVPNYQIVRVATHGLERDVLVAVDTTVRLRRVFGAVIDGLEDPAAYHITIQCAGSRAPLASGDYARGDAAADKLGLPDQGFRYAAVPGATCAAAGRA